VHSLQAASSSLTKTGKDGTTGSATNVQDGNAAKWVMSYANISAGNANVSFSDPIPGFSQYIAGSLKVPKGWNKQWSTGANCSSPVSVEPAPASVTHICSGASIVPSPATGSSAPAPQPLTSFTNSSDQDGYQPIVYANRIIVLAHHSQSYTCLGTWVALTSTCTGTNVGNTANFDCFEQSTGGPCTGMVGTPYVSSQAGAAIGSGPHDLGITQYPREFTDDGTYGHADNMYFPAMKPDSPGSNSATGLGSSFGVGCVNPVTLTSCGYTALGTGKAELFTGGNSNAVFEGLQRSGSKLYGVAYDGKMYCFDMSTVAPCAGQPYTTSWTAWDAAAKDRGMYIQHYTASDNRQYWLFNYATGCNEGGSFVGNIFIGFTWAPSCPQVNNQTKLYCFDPATNLPCTSWSDPGYSLNIGTNAFGNSSYAVAAGTSIYEQRNTSNVIDRICIGGVYQSTPATPIDVYGFNACYTLSGGASSLPGGFFNNVTGGARITTTNGVPAIIGSKMYVDVYTQDNIPDNSTPDTWLVCWDYSTAAQCSGFGNSPSGTPTVDYFPSLSSGNPTGYTVREFNGCVWMAGDSLGSSSGSNDIWSVDPTTGNTPCKKVFVPMTLTPSTDFYCDGGSGHVTAWDKLKIALPSGSTYADFNNIKVTLKDSSNNVLLGINQVDITITSGLVTAPGVLDISSLNYGAYPNIKAEILFDAINTNPWPPGDSPRAMLTFSGDNPQICFDTTITADCDTVSIDNTATTITTDSFGSDTKTASKNLIVNHAPGTSCFKNISIEKTNGLNTVKKGSAITYSLRVTNKAEVPGGAGQGNLTNISVSDSLPSYLDYVDAPANGGCSAGSLSGPTVTWTISSLIASNNTTCLLTVKLNSSFVGNNVINQASTSVAGEDSQLLSDNTSSKSNGLDPSNTALTPEQLAAFGAKSLISVIFAGLIASGIVRLYKRYAINKS